MKSRKKVISQKHIKEIPSQMFGHHGYGLMNHGIEKSITKAKSPARERRRQQKQSRIINRSK